MDCESDTPLGIDSQWWRLVLALFTVSGVVPRVTRRAVWLRSAVREDGVGQTDLGVSVVERAVCKRPVTAAKVQNCGPEQGVPGVFSLNPSAVRGLLMCGDSRRKAHSR